MSDTYSCEIYLIRHGETEWNQQGRIQGQTDIPLNEVGITQALELGEQLASIEFSAVYTSDLQRARATAELVIGQRNIPIIETGALRERCAGSLEGQYATDFDQHIHPFFLSEKAFNHEDYLKTPWHEELETSSSVYERVVSFLSTHAKHHDNQNILVSTHGGVLRSLLDHLHFIPGERWMVSNCGFIKLEWTEKGLTVLEHHRVTRSSILHRSR